MKKTKSKEAIPNVLIDVYNKKLAPFIELRNKIEELNSKIFTESMTFLMNDPTFKYEIGSYNYFTQIRIFTDDYRQYIFLNIIPFTKYMDPDFCIPTIRKNSEYVYQAVRKCFPKSVLDNLKLLRTTLATYRKNEKAFKKTLREMDNQFNIDISSLYKEFKRQNDKEVKYSLTAS